MEKGKNYVKLKADDTPTLVSWNPNGSLIGVTTKKKTMNIFDPRTKKVTLKQKINESFINSKFAWIDNNIFATTSWTKDEYKVLKLWDIRKIKNDLSCENEINMIQINKSKNPSNLFANREFKYLYMTTKEESLINIYDFSEGIFKQKNPPFKCTEIPNYSVLFDKK